MATTDMNAQIHIKDGNGNVNNIFPATKIANVEGLQTALNSKANTSDVTSGLAGKVDKETGKGLSTNDYTTAEKNKLAGIAAGATAVTVDSTLSGSSTNAIQNKAVYDGLAAKANTNHNQASSTINTMTGYSKASAESAISTSDTLNAALGKLEYGIDLIKNDIAKLLNFITPENFGAVGDGTADDSMAFQSCVNYAIAHQIIIRLNPKTYKITNSISINGGCKIIGYQSSDFWSAYADTNRSIILSSVGSNAVFNISKTTSWNNNPTDEDRISGVEISNIAIKSSGNNHGAIYCHCYNAKFENIRITNFGIGIHCVNSYKTEFINVNIFFTSLGYAFRSNGPDVVIRGGWVQYNGDLSTLTELPSEVYNSLMNKGLYINAITGVILFDSKLTAYDFAVEGLNYGFQVSAESELVANNLNIEKITTVGIYSNYNYDEYLMANYVYIDSLNLWGFKNGAKYWKAKANALYQIRLNNEECKLIEVSNTFDSYWNVNGARYVVSDANGEKVYNNILPNSVTVNGGEYIDRSHFTKSGYFVDITMNNLDATYTQRLSLNIPIAKKIQSDYSFANNFSQFIDGIAMDTTTGDMIPIRLRSDYELVWYNKTNGTWDYILPSKLVNLVFRLTGEIKLLLEKDA